MTVVIRNLYTSTTNAKRLTYKNQSQLRIELPFRALIIGKSGSMKSNLMFNLIELINSWTTIYIFAKNLEQPLYKTFIPAFEQAGGTIIASTDLIDLPAIEDIDNPERVLVIFDDLLAERNLTRVSDYFLRSRSLGISLIFVSQKAQGPGSTPMMIRSNCDYVFLKQFTALNSVKRFLSEYDLPEDALQKYKRATQKPEDFLLIDTISSDDRFKLRHNFSPFT